MPRPKVPQKPTQPLTFPPDDIVTYVGPLARLHRIRGAHPVRWDQFRKFGPLGDQRWDAHDPPPSIQPDRAILYACTDVVTCFAEVFQQERTVLADDTRALAAWTPTRPLRLLDLRADWPINNGAAASLHAAPKNVCRAWAREVARQSTAVGIGLDGLIAPSTMRGRKDVVVLNSNSATAFPPAPETERVLNDSAVAGVLEEVQKRLRWPVVLS